MIPVAAETRERVRKAMAATPRADFLPEPVRHLADVDRPVMIGWDATNSQPSTVARMLELLDVQPGHRVLDVGSGSGWTTAILSRLAGEGGSVFGVERVPELVEYGRARLVEAGHPLGGTGSGPVIELAAPGVLGLPAEAPFERILVSADFGSLPHALVDQLVDSGRLVAPVAGVMAVVEKRDGKSEVHHDAGLYTFVPLIEE